MDQPPSTSIEHRQAPGDSPFRSFWMAGYEGADHVNGQQQALDMARSNRHVELIDDDYRRAARLGLRTVRETIGWRLSETREGRIDLSRAVAAMQAAERHGIQIVWTLMHYGTPDGVRIDGDCWFDRFASFAATVARTLKRLHREPPIYNPINEMNYLAWAVSATPLIHPYQARSTPGLQQGSGFEAKCRLVQASLRAIAAIRAEDPRARFMHIEPVVHVVAPADEPELHEFAAHIRGFQWQAWDMLSGRLLPELGGHPEALDLMGLNHYYDAQWEAGTEKRIEWHLKDPRWMPLSDLLEEVWQRYRRPLVIAETSHLGSGRAEWMNDIGRSAHRARARGVDLQGVCLYPAVDRPDWSDATHWHHSGLWDVLPGEAMDRRLHFGYARALRRWQQSV